MDRQMDKYDESHTRPFECLIVSVPASYEIWKNS